MKPENFISTLESISIDNGVPYGRAHALFDEEQLHERAALGYKGYLALSDAFKCFFLETVERLNTECAPKVSDMLPSDYVLFLPRMTNAFRALCGAERIALKGYPYQGYTILRNIFDNLLYVSAVFLRLTDFQSLEGILDGESYDEDKARSRRKKAQRTVHQQMLGEKSGLSEQAIAELKRWDAMFDWETHGSRMSIAQAVPWMKGASPLRVLPVFDEKASANFMNRFGEIAWTFHRLIPFIQPTGVLIGSGWPEKWVTLDDAFLSYVGWLTEKNAKPIGAAFQELVSAKFPYRADNTFPAR